MPVIPTGGLGPQGPSSSSSKISAQPKQVVTETIDKLIYIDHKCHHPVQVKRPIGDIVHLFKTPPNSIEFSKVSDCKIEYQLESVETQPTIYDKNTLSAHCQFRKSPRSNAIFQWDYTAATKTVFLQESYNGLLPRWTQAGDKTKWLHPEKGVPTAKVMTVLLFHKLELNKAKVTNAGSCAMNAQTVVDVLHAMLVKEKSVEDAFAESQTVQLLSELGQMLGYKKMILTSIKADTRGAYTFIPTSLTYSGWNPEQIKAFKNQPKIKELEAAGVPILAPDFQVPDALDIEVRFSD